MNGQRDQNANPFSRDEFSEEGKDSCNSRRSPLRLRFQGQFYFVIQVNSSSLACLSLSESNFILLELRFCLAKFVSKWQKSEKSETVGSRIKDGLKSSEPIKPRLEQASRQIQMQMTKLDQAAAKLSEKDNSVFSSIVFSVQRNDNARANMLANELIEIRKMKNLVVQAKLALEQITLRLTTVTELGDIAATLTPALNTIKSVRPGLSSLVPDAEHEVAEISGLLSGLMVEAGGVNPQQITFSSTNEEAERVLAQAAMMVEQRERAKYPDVPDTEYVEPALE